MSLETLLKNRENEFKEIADAINLDMATPNWKEVVLDFSIDFHNCLKSWKNGISKDNEIRKCNNIMIKVSRKKGISQMLQLLYIINRIAEDFEILLTKEQKSRVLN